MIYKRSTFKELTAPGYFDFSAQQLPKTKSIIDWFDRITKIWENQVNLFDETFRLWATRNYSGVTVSMPTYLVYLLKQNGIRWFQGTIPQAAALLSYSSKSYPQKTVLCLQELFTFLLNAPIQWTTQTGEILFGVNYPARFAETLIMYSSSGSPPATPSSQTYTALTWSAPAGWSKTALNSTYYTRGYLSGGNIIWMSPRLTSSVSIMQDVANIGSLPISPSEGDLCGVNDDGTGDIGSVYYYDGGTWRKTTTPNANQGQVSGGVPPDPGSSVFAPNDGTFIKSSTQTPILGNSQGFGYYGILGNFTMLSRRIDIVLQLTNGGVSNLGVIIFLLRKIKPVLNSFYLSYTTPSNSNYTTIEILDSGAV